MEKLSENWKREKPIPLWLARMANRPELKAANKRPLNFWPGAILIAVIFILFPLALERACNAEGPAIYSDVMRDVPISPVGENRNDNGLQGLLFTEREMDPEYMEKAKRLSIRGK